MITSVPIPQKNEEYWFFANDQVKLETEYKARIVNILSYEDAGSVFIDKYDDNLQDIVPNPVLDIWIEQVFEMFWILAPETDYIIELSIPELCPQSVYVARDLDNGWHSFETHMPKQWGFLDITGENHNKLHKINTLIVDDLPE